MAKSSTNSDNKTPKPRPAEKALKADFVTLCWISGTSGATAPRLCVCLSKKHNGPDSLQQSAGWLFQTSLEFLPNAPALKQLRNPTIGPNRQTLTELRKRAESEGKMDFLDADQTAEGGVWDIQAVGVGPNRHLKERAYWLAMSAMILLQNPEECATVCNYGAKNLVQEARQWHEGVEPVDIFS